MITIIDSPAIASSQWREFSDELNRWAAEGRIATLWWRDDDATAPCPQLEALLRLADGVPVALAVIPAIAGSTLATWLEDCVPSGVRILQHGWRHANHGSSGKKSEFPNSRAPERAAADLTAGCRRIATLFGSRALAVLAPPWNRFDAAFFPLLGDAGIVAISTIKPRAVPHPVPGVFAANVQVDLVAWRDHRGFIGAGAALAGLTAHLRARRCGLVDAEEPTGILTHHLVQDEDTGAFLAELIALTRQHPAARWLDAEEVFAPAGVAVTGGHRV
jgi:hypothetical protein